MITIYTDGSTCRDRASVAFIVLDFINQRYLCSGTCKYETHKNSTAEMFAVRDALIKLTSEYDLKDREVTVFSDFDFLSRLWSRYMEGISIKSTIFNEIIELSKNFKSFNIKYVSSHVGSFSPNKACDCLARRYR